MAVTCPRKAILAIVALAVLPAPASARWFGSTLRGRVNATFGCESAVVYGPVGGVVLQDTNQGSCTYRHVGYLYSNRFTFLVPGSGRIARVRVKAGRHPAKLRVTVLTGSSRVDPFTGRDQPGTYTCCTARYIGRAFRPRANRVTTRRVNIRVSDVRSKRLRYRIHSTDGLALSAFGRGTLPLHIAASVGGYQAGTPIATAYFPYTRQGDPRVEGTTMTGVDLLFQWDFRRR